MQFWQKLQKSRTAAATLRKSADGLTAGRFGWLCKIGLIIR